jgi:hypothetical protein
VYWKNRRANIKKKVYWKNRAQENIEDNNSTNTQVKEWLERILKNML